MAGLPKGGLWFQITWVHILTLYLNCWLNMSKLFTFHSLSSLVSKRTRSLS